MCNLNAPRLAAGAWALFSLLAASAAGAASAAPGQAAPRRIVFLAGGGSHGFGAHAHYAGCMLLAGLLRDNVPGTDTAVYRGWPKDPKALDGVSALVLDCDGGAFQLIGSHAATVESLAKSGVGIACLHYTVVVPKGPPGDALRRWIGGAYETHWSVNPVWTARFTSLPKHPITRGVRPFAIRDEWYYHMRFVEGMKGVTPILTAVPPDSTRKRPLGAHSGNAAVRARMGKPEHVAWAYERPGGGRGFGYTGNHWHWNWAHDDVRTLVLNALVWVAGGEVPAGGVPSKRPTVEQLTANLGGAKPKGWRPEQLQRTIEELNRPPAAPK